MSITEEQSMLQKIPGRIRDQQAKLLKFGWNRTQILLPNVAETRPI